MKKGRNLEAQNRTAGLPRRVAALTTALTTWWAVALGIVLPTVAAAFFKLDWIVSISSFFTLCCVVYLILKLLRWLSAKPKAKNLIQNARLIVRTYLYVNLKSTLIIIALLLSVPIWMLLHSKLDGFLFRTGRFGEPTDNRYIEIRTFYSPFSLPNRYEMVVEFGVRFVSVTGGKFEVNPDAHGLDIIADHWYNSPGIFQAPSYQINRENQVPDSLVSVNALDGFGVESSKIAVTRNRSYYIRLRSEQPLFVAGYSFSDIASSRAGHENQVELKTYLETFPGIQKQSFTLISVLQEIDSLVLDIDTYVDSILTNSSHDNDFSPGWIDSSVRRNQREFKERRSRFEARVLSLNWKLSKFGKEIPTPQYVALINPLTLQDYAASLRSIKLVIDTLGIDK